MPRKLQSAMKRSAKPSMPWCKRGSTDARARALETGRRELHDDNRVLTTVLEKRQTHATQISEVPADLVEIGQRAVAAIYAAVQRQAASKIELIETNSRKLIDAAITPAEAPSRSNDSNARPSKRRRPSPPPAIDPGGPDARRARRATHRQLRRRSSASSARSSAPGDAQAARRAIRRPRNAPPAAKRPAGFRDRYAQGNRCPTEMLGPSRSADRSRKPRRLFAAGGAFLGLLIALRAWPSAPGAPDIAPRALDLRLSCL